LQRYVGAMLRTQIHIGRRTWQAYCHAVNETAAATYGGDLKFNSGARESNRLPACLVITVPWLAYKDTPTIALVLSA